LKTLEQYQEMFSLRAVNTALLHMVDSEIYMIEQEYKCMGYNIGEAIHHTNSFSVEAWQYLGEVKSQIRNIMNGGRR
jgi:GTP-sensing pleiotropic transcriptional regulator CodY